VLLDGKYQLVRCLGQGGMGEVWEAEHAKLGRRVAIKFIHAEAAQNEAVLQRFQNEARASAKLQSRFIVQVIDDGVDQGGRPYIVMEKLSGESLGDRLGRDRTLEVEAVRQILRDVCRGLSVAHEAGIVHRDLKPDNIFLHRGPDDDHETAKLVDFGIAKISEGALGPGQSTTQTGSLLGTPLYMSPEQARGAKPIDARTDIWSLGVVAYECLTGDVPFRGSTVGDIAIHICLSPHEPPSARRPGLPAALDGWVSRALAKDKNYRFSSVTEMFAAFERALAGELIEPPPPGATAPFPDRVTGDANTLDLAPSTGRVNSPHPRRPVAPMPQVREARDSEPSGAHTTPDDRPLTLGPVATRGPGPTRRGAPRGLLAIGAIVAVGVAAVGFSVTHKDEDHPSATSSPSSQGAQGGVGSAREPVATAPSPSASAPSSAAVTAAPSPSAPTGLSTRPPAAGPRPPGPTRRKGPATNGEDLGY
jgi:serine/threonine-protein kinase